MARAVVAVLKTSPETVTTDYRRLLDLIDARGSLDHGANTVLAVDLPWHHFTPACNTAPWQIDGVAGGLAGLGFAPRTMFASINAAAGLSVRHGEVLNRQRVAAERHDITVIHPGKDAPFLPYRASTRLRMLDRIYPDGIPVPGPFIGANAIMLPVMRTHAALVVAGALYTGFGATLDKRRYRAKARFAEALVDVLAIQREMHTGMVAVADGAFAGQGPDPRRLTPVEANLIAASPDPVALDAVTARLMGFDPTTIPTLNIAADAGLGVCDPRDIELRGDDVSDVNLRFSAGNSGSSSTAGQMPHFLRSAFPGTAEHLSMIYHDWYWYNHYSAKIVNKAMKTGWGRLFEEYRK